MSDDDDLSFLDDDDTPSSGTMSNRTDTKQKPKNQILFEMIVTNDTRKQVLKIWLEDVLDIFNTMQFDDGFTVKRSDKTLGRESIAKWLIKFYIEKHRIHVFNDLYKNLPTVLDLDVVASMIVNEPEIKAAIDKYK